MSGPCFIIRKARPSHGLDRPTFRGKASAASRYDQLVSIDSSQFHGFLFIVYDDSIDHAGHSYGPMSINVNVGLLLRISSPAIHSMPVSQETLPKMDNFARNLLDSLEHRNLSGIVDVIFVSDHGMTDTSNLDPIYVDEILGDGYQDIVERSGKVFTRLFEHIHEPLCFSFRRSLDGPKVQTWCKRDKIHRTSSKRGRRQSWKIQYLHPRYHA